MNSFERSKAVRKILLNNMAQCITYTNWSDKFVIEELRRIPETLKKQEFKLIDPLDLTKGEMVELGFGMWDEESGIMLIPLWILPYLVDSFPARSISGEDIFKKSEMDTDVRFGCVAYGVVPKVVD